jgi:hypothetical protein
MKLPQLQNLIKRDPAAYEDEFLQQLRSFEAEMQVRSFPLFQGGGGGGGGSVCSGGGDSWAGRVGCSSLS